LHAGSQVRIKGILL